MIAYILIASKDRNQHDASDANENGKDLEDRHLFFENEDGENEHKNGV